MSKRLLGDDSAVCLTWKYRLLPEGVLLSLTQVPSVLYEKRIVFTFKMFVGTDTWNPQEGLAQQSFAFGP